MTFTCLSQKDSKIERYRKMKRWNDRKTERQKDRKMKRWNDRKIERQKDRKIEKLKN